MTDRMPESRCLEKLVDDPVNDTVHQPFSAFNQGFDAFGWGLLRNQNPYDYGTNRRWWDEGWSAAYDAIMKKAEGLKTEPE